MPSANFSKIYSCCGSPLSDCRLLFANRPPSIELVAPDNLDFIYDVLNEKYGTLDAAIKFMSEWIPSLQDFHLDLSVFLAYAPSKNARNAVRTCWNKLDQTTMTVESLIHRIFDDPRYEQIPDELKQYRPAGRLSELISFDIEAFPKLIACHRMVCNGDASRDLVQESVRRFFRQLNLTVGRLEVFARSGAALGMRHTTLLPIVRALSPLPSEVLHGWCSRYPKQRDSADSPRYYLGHGVVIGIVATGFNTVPLYAFLLKRRDGWKENRQLEHEALPDDEKRVYTVQELRDVCARFSDSSP
ncbi:uncharacterized protein JCM6883_005385 [Sporobolomyces salmoneus]|uniref:uncharacterized protein n=1 Tax=Sporobolomyces salmoneus TaxID=183962 RepID=UPI003181CC23